MLRAGSFGFIAAASLILGAWLGAVLHLSTRSLGLVMGFGAGALISAISFELVEKAIVDGTPLLTFGLASGALVYFVAARLLVRAATRRGDMDSSEASGLAITVGATLDGIPESVILGTSLIGGGPVPLAFGSCGSPSPRAWRPPWGSRCSTTSTRARSRSSSPSRQGGSSRW